jgi:predicted ATP-grasp superfamily ATP-dependent carboligase
MLPPIEDEAAYGEAILQIVNGDCYAGLFVIPERGLRIISACRATLNIAVDRLLPPAEAVEVALSKNRLMRFARQVGVAVPQTWAIRDLDELRSIIGQLRFPVAVKGESGSASKLVRFAGSARDLETKYLAVRSAEAAYGGEPAVQEFIPGPGVTFCGLFRDGRLLRQCMYYRTREYPLFAGQSVKAITFFDPRLETAGTRLFGALRWTGIGQAEFRFDPRDETYKLTDLNPRAFGGIELPARAGVDLPYLLCAQGAGTDLTGELRFRTGVKLRRLFPYDLLILIARPWLLLQYLLETFDVTLHSDFHPADPVAQLLEIRTLVWHVGNAWAEGTLFTGHRDGPVLRAARRMPVWRWVRDQRHAWRAAEIRSNP